MTRPQRNEWIAAWTMAGYKRSDIAKAFHVSQQWVRMIGRQAGLPAYSRPGRNQ